MRYLVTGATGELGGLLCVELANMGHALSVMARDIDRWFALPRPPADLIPIDGMEEPILLTNRIESHVREFGPLDGIVHCAGHEVIAPLGRMTDRRFFEAMQPAVQAFALLRAAARTGVMVDGGSIVMVSSVSAARSSGAIGAYAASKACIEALARSAALEMAPRSIRVNCVAPGAFLSPMHDRITGVQTTTAAEAYRAKHPLGFGEPDDVVAAILFLLDSVAARWVTGSVMAVDGGFSAA